jgi:hypothetical protein
MPLSIQVGDTIETKKKHPCGGNTFKVLRTGIDFRIACTTCDKQIWIPRNKLEKRVKRIIPGEQENENG